MSNTGMSDTRYIPLGFQVGKYFWFYEFECKCRERGLSRHNGYCGGAVLIEPRLVEILDVIRSKKGKTHITSGYRCPKYHTHIYELLGREPTKNSTHGSGRGVDLWTKKALRYPDDKNFLVDIGINGIGYREEGGRIVHIDIGHSMLTTWTY